MSVYLGNAKIGVSHTTGVILGEGDEVLRSSQMTQLNDAVNYRSGKFDTNTIPEMINELKQKYMIHLSNTMNTRSADSSTWTRPQEWPDLDSLNLQMSGNTDFIYMTFDANKSNSGVCFNITGSNIEVTRGHISSGTYIPDETITKSGNYYTKSFASLSDYIVMRITGTISTCYFTNSSDYVSGHTQIAAQTPLLERIAYIPHFTRLGNETTRGNWGTMSLVREKIANGTGTALTNASYAYFNSFNLQSLDLTGLLTPNVTTFAYMFYRCYSLYHALDLRHFSVTKATTFAAMFAYCKTPEINLTGWTTTALTGGGLASMFQCCERVTHIYGLDNFTTTNCTSLASMFYDCYNLIELDLSTWNTNKVTSFASLFRNCRTLKNLDFVSNWSTGALTSIYETFSWCWNIEKLDLHNWNVSKVTNVSYTFNQCLSLKQLNITGWNFTANKITSAAYCFTGCASLQNIDLTNWRIDSKCTSIYQMFYNCCSLQSLAIPNWTISNMASGNYSLGYVFANCYSLKTITGVSEWKFPSGNTTYMFNNCYSLETVDVSNWNTTDSKSLANTFTNCYSLRTIDVSSWVTTNVTSFASMFSNCCNLITLNVSGFSTANATTIADMFQGCTSLISTGDISGWNVEKVTTAAELFYNCASIKNISINDWTLTKVTTISYIFRNCYNLETLSLNNWSLPACTNISDAFNGCYHLRSLSLTNWSLPKLSTAPTNLFRYCYNLQDFSGLSIGLAHSYAQCYNLTYDSILAIYNALPTIATAKAITVDTYVHNQLNATEQAIPTGKGWTITTTT